MRPRGNRDRILTDSIRGVSSYGRLPYATHLVAIILLAPIFFGSKAGAQTIVITPSTLPTAFQGTTLQFSETGGAGTWSCPGCAGSIDSATGLYTAPTTIHAQQSFGGYQLLPNNHIFNTRIDSLPVNSSSTYLINGAGTANLIYEPGFPSNYVNGHTPTASQSFLYTPKNNGTFQIPEYPLAEMESGWLSNLSAGDHHMITIDTTTGVFQEIYQPATNGDIPGSCTPSPCTADSGVRYQNSTYDLPNTQGGSTDAAGLYLVPLTLHPQELEYAVVHSTTINHALRFTLGNGYICGSSVANACAQNATGARHLWPATAEAFEGAGVVPYGARFRLKAAFNTSKFSPIAKILLTQLKQYGIILADGGTNWAVSAPASGKIPVAYVNAFQEIYVAGIGPSNFEAVDESSLMISPTSGNTSQNRETVIFTRTYDAATASVDVVLTGVTVNLPSDILYFQAGIPAQQLRAFVHGGSNNTVRWAMTPAVGRINPTTGLYTPPSTSATIQTTRVTATSTDDPTVSAQMTLAIYPNGAIRVIPAQSNCGNTSPTGSYTDSHGNVWLYGVGGDGRYGYPTSNPPRITDFSIYEFPIAGDASAADLRFDITVPTGTYQITGKFISTDNSAGQKKFSIEANGVTSFSNFDPFAVSGGRNTPIDEISTVTISNGGLSYGELSYVLRPGPATSSQNQANISALQIIPIAPVRASRRQAKPARHQKRPPRSGKPPL